MSLFLGNAAEVFRHYRGTCTFASVATNMYVCMYVLVGTESETETGTKREEERNWGKILYY